MGVGRAVVQSLQARRSHGHPSADSHILSRNGRYAIARRRNPSASVCQSPRNCHRSLQERSGGQGKRQHVHLLRGGQPQPAHIPGLLCPAEDIPEAEESFERNNTYLLWEVGKAPDFVLEIGSESTADVDLGSKRDLYAELGVGEYWRYDPTGGEFYGEPLVGEYLVDGEYRPIHLNHESDGRVWGHSEALNLDLWWEDGELRFWDPAAGRWLLNLEEEHDGRIAAEDRAATERATRIVAQNRAAEDRADFEARIAELEAENRRLRGER